MLWVCRPGKNAVHIQRFIEQKKIYLAWDGFCVDLISYDTREQFKELVKLEKSPTSRTSISNWSGQLYSFCKEMNVGDYVLIPYKSSKKYILASICGEYEYDEDDELHHSRSIKFIVDNIQRDLFPQNIQYSLGAFRTLFKVRQEKEVLDIINVWRQKNGH